MRNLGIGVQVQDSCAGVNNYFILFATHYFITTTNFRFFRAVNCQILGDIRTEALIEIYNSNLPSLHFEIAKPTNLNCQSPKEGLWDVSVKQIKMFEDNPETVPVDVNQTESGSSENSDIE